MDKIIGRITIKKKHKITLKRWQEYSLSEQLGNIGSEISRARHWEKMCDFTNKERALERALELLDLTVADKRWQSRLKELTRLREIIGDLMAKTKIYNISLKDLEKFCLGFAMMAMR